MSDSGGMMGDGAPGDREGGIWEIRPQSGIIYPLSNKNSVSGSRDLAGSVRLNWILPVQK